ncbi:hypothetical protein BC831DRAFT_234012 [Entophlyctis helioformis]|nr:hypothetical protein BC831DRAFT_234012 [Entophlyctis helioformis]
MLVMRHQATTQQRDTAARSVPFAVVRRDHAVACEDAFACLRRATDERQVGQPQQQQQLKPDTHAKPCGMRAPPADIAVRAGRGTLTRLDFNQARPWHLRSSLRHQKRRQALCGRDLEIAPSPASDRDARWCSSGNGKAVSGRCCRHCEGT